jgi:nucleotide-binding universal stress UspA family protein
MKRQLSKSHPSVAAVQRILVPVNFTDASIRAAEYAARLARALKTTVTLLHIVEEDLPKTDSEESREQLLKSIHDAADQKLQSFAHLFVGNGIATEIIVAIGKPVQQILYEITEMNPDLVVMTSRYRKPMRWFWQRDTTLEILERAPCPVAVLRDTGTEANDLILY